MLTSCPDCGGSVRHVDRRNDLTNTNHHNNVYRCGECGRTILSG